MSPNSVSSNCKVDVKLQQMPQTEKTLVQHRQTAENRSKELTVLLVKLQVLEL